MKYINTVRKKKKKSITTVTGQNWMQAPYIDQHQNKSIKGEPCNIYYIQQNQPKRKKDRQRKKWNLTLKKEKNIKKTILWGFSSQQPIEPLYVALTQKINALKILSPLHASESKRTSWRLNFTFGSNLSTFNPKKTLLWLEAAAIHLILVILCYFRWTSRWHLTASINPVVEAFRCQGGIPTGIISRRHLPFFC